MTRPVIAAANSQANGLAFPSKREMTEGSPKTPLPMMQLTISAVRLQRPMERSRVGWVSDTSGLYHGSVGGCDHTGFVLLSQRTTNVKIQLRSQKKLDTISAVAHNSFDFERITSS